MKRFKKKIIIFTSLYILFLLFIYWINNGSFNLDYKSSEDKVFIKKLDNFHQYIKTRRNVNLILGSSMMESSVIPDSLGINWFSFSNPRQNIYESYKFIDAYKQNIKIDTIVIGIQPFDFPISYLKNRKDNKPFVNGGFHIISSDSITSMNQKLYLKKLQIIKDNSFPKINFKSKNIHNYKFTKRGFRILNGFDLDSLFIVKPHRFNKYKDYFVNVYSSPNLKYFNLFQSLIESLEIEVIYLVTPKSRYYLSGERQNDSKSTWNNILINLEKQPIALWNYENIFDNNISTLFFDETHLSKKGADMFTIIIRERLKSI